MYNYEFKIQTPYTLFGILSKWAFDNIDLPM